MMRTSVPRGLCASPCHLATQAGLVFLWTGALVAFNYLLQPQHQGFFCDDTTIRYPYVHDTVGNTLILVVTLATPLLMVVLTEGSHCVRRAVGVGGGRSPGDRAGPGVWAVAGAYLLYFWGYLALTTAVVVLKQTTGQLRPHFLHVCMPDVNLSTCTGYISDYNCTATEEGGKLVTNARQSFPSGHAAYAVYMALFVILYFHVRLRLHQLHVLRLTLYAVLMTYALWCSATRVSDHMHHVTDVIAGGSLGGVVAVMTFVYGSLHCLRPEPRQSPDPETGGAGHEDPDRMHMAPASHNANNNNNSSSSGSNNNNNSNNNNSTSSMDEDEMETEAPGTPTPLLLNSVQDASRRGTVRIGSIRLVGDKSQFRKFSLR